MGVVISEDGAFAALFYALTGAMVFLYLTGLAYTTVAAVRYLGGRTDLEAVSIPRPLLVLPHRGDHRRLVRGLHPEMTCQD